MTGSLDSVHPEPIPEWSEKNLSLTPDTQVSKLSCLFGVCLKKAGSEEHTNSRANLRSDDQKYYFSTKITLFFYYFSLLYRLLQ